MRSEKKTLSLVQSWLHHTEERQVAGGLNKHVMSPLSMWGGPVRVHAPARFLDNTGKKIITIYTTH